MPANTTPNYCKMVLRTFHASPATVVLRELLGVHNSQQRFPNVADVRSGTLYGPSVYDQVGYLTGTMVAGGGSAAFRVVGSPVVRRLR